MIKNLLLTGLPGAGKTTLIKHAVDLLLQFDFKIDGFYTEEIRKDDQRIGLKLIAIDGSEAVLADLQGDYPRFGKYTVYTERLDSVGVLAIERALTTADIIIIDEIGCMEMLSQEFADAVNRALESDKIVIATITISTKDPEIQLIKARSDVRVMELTQANRDKMVEETAYWASEVVKELIRASDEPADKNT